MKSFIFRVIVYCHHRADSVTNGKGGPVGLSDDHHALLVYYQAYLIAWRGVPWYIHVSTQMKKTLNCM